MSMPNNKNMIHTQSKLMLLLFLALMFIQEGYAQNNADPGIGITMSPPSVTQGSTGVLRTTVGNYGNDSIVENSLRVTISVGSNAEIIGIAIGSDTRWSQLSMTRGSANTIKLINSGGSFGAFDVGDIFLTIRGNVVSESELILGNIVYITARNPTLCGGCSEPPLNVSQGNASSLNDNSQTSFAVTASSIDAVNDNTYTTQTPSTTGPITVGNVTINDSLNGSLVTASNTDVTPVSTGELSIDADGVLTLAANTPPGTYNITYQLCEVASSPSNCDTATATVNVACEQIDTPTISIIQPTCNTATGTVTVTAPTGTGLSYSINSSSYQNGTSFAGLASGNYNVTAKNAVGCVSTATVAVINAQSAAPVQVTLGTVTQPTCTTATGSFSITNYDASYTYAVNPSTGVSVSGNTITAPTGNYTVTATSGACTSPASANITVNGQVATATAPVITASKTEVCGTTEKATLTASGCTDGTITWSGGLGTGTAKEVGSGTYTATCTRSCGASEASNSVTITESQPPVALSISADRTSLCGSELVTLTSTGCTGTVAWSNSATGTTIRVGVGTYTATCSTTCGTSNVSNNLTIINVQQAAPTIISNKTLICGNEQATLTANNCTGLVTWSNGATGNTTVVTLTETTKFTAFCTTGSCISANSNSVEIVVGAPNKPTITCRTSSICLGETISITATGCTGTIQWSNGASGGVLEVIPDATGSYTYTATCKSNVGDCESAASNQIMINVGATISSPTVVANISNICPIQTADLSSALMGTSSGSFEFHVSNSSNSALITNSGVVTAGTYYVFDRSDLGCYSNASAINVTITDCEDNPVDSTQNVDIAVIKIGSANVVAVGDTVTYTIQVSNVSQNMATQVEVRDVVPNSLTFLNSSLNVTFANGTVTSLMDTLKTGTSYSFTYDARVSAAGKIVNKAELFGVGQIDNILSNNVSEFTINNPIDGDLIGVSKVVGDYVALGNNQFEVPYTIYVSNMGGGALSNVQVTDDLVSTFGNGAVIISDTLEVTATGTLTANPNFTGKAGGSELLIDSLSTLAVGDRFSMSFTVKVDISGASTDEYFNTAIGTAGPDSLRVIDRSTSGLNADPDNDGDPRNNDEATSVKFDVDGLIVNPAIGVALSVVDALEHDAMSYDITYRVIVMNVGNVDLTYVQLVDSLEQTFSDTLNYEILGVPVVAKEAAKLRVANDKLNVADCDPRANENFDGKMDNNLLIADSTCILPVGRAYILFYTVRLYHEGNAGPFHNQVLSHGNGIGTAVRDTSNDGFVIQQEISSPTVITLQISSDANLVIQEGFSPNGDGVNDTWKLDIPTGVKVTEVMMYNRWGHLVWKPLVIGDVATFLEWNGEANQGIRFDSSEFMPDGTYFYHIETDKDDQPLVGFITISR